VKQESILTARLVLNIIRFTGTPSRDTFDEGPEVPAGGRGRLLVPPGAAGHFLQEILAAHKAHLQLACHGGGSAHGGVRRLLVGVVHGTPSEGVQAGVRHRHGAGGQRVLKIALQLGGGGRVGRKFLATELQRLPEKVQLLARLR